MSHYKGNARLLRVLVIAFVGILGYLSIPNGKHRETLASDPLTFDGEVSCSALCSSGQACRVRIQPSGSSPRAEVIHGYWIGRDPSSGELLEYFDDGLLLIEPGVNDDGIVRTKPLPLAIEQATATAATPTTTSPPPAVTIVWPPLTPPSGPIVCPYYMPEPMSKDWSYAWVQVSYDDPDSEVNVTLEDDDCYPVEVPAWDPRCGPTLLPTNTLTSTPTKTPTPTSTVPPTLTSVPVSTTNPTDCPSCYPAPGASGATPTIQACQGAPLPTPEICEPPDSCQATVYGNSAFVYDTTCYACGYGNHDAFIDEILKKLVLEDLHDLFKDKTKVRFYHCLEFSGDPDEPTPAPQPTPKLWTMRCPATRAWGIPGGFEPSHPCRSCGIMVPSSTTSRRAHIFTQAYFPAVTLHEMYHAWVYHTMTTTQQRKYFSCATPIVMKWLQNCKGIAPGGAPTPTPIAIPGGSEMRQRLCTAIQEEDAATDTSPGSPEWTEEILAQILELTSSCDMLSCETWMPEEIRSFYREFLTCASSAQDWSCSP
jgi:hypothetical protein